MSNLVDNTLLFEGASNSYCRLNAVPRYARVMIASRGALVMATFPRGGLCHPAPGPSPVLTLTDATSNTTGPAGVCADVAATPHTSARISKARGINILVFRIGEQPAFRTSPPSGRSSHVATDPFFGTCTYEMQHDDGEIAGDCEGRLLVRFSRSPTADAKARLDRRLAGTSCCGGNRDSEVQDDVRDGDSRQP